MNIRLGKTKFHSLITQLDSGSSSFLVLGKNKNYATKILRQSHGKPKVVTFRQHIPPMYNSYYLNWMRRKSWREILTCTTRRKIQGTI